MVRSAHNREAEYYARQLADLDDPELITPAELIALQAGSRRAGARWHAQDRAGIRARKAVRRLQRAQARLAVEISRGTEDLGRWHHDVRHQRGLLQALGHPEAVAPEGKGPWRRTASTVFTTALAIAVLWAAISTLGGG